MAEPEPSSPNADQVAYWNAAAGETWVALQDRLDALIEPLGARALAALGPAPGERVIDVGCGCGQTSLALAAKVGPAGQVLGVDISRPMLAVAQRRAAEQGLAQAGFVEADAQTHGFAPAAFDAAFSRFGVMFFAQPPAAFANLRQALRPGGRLAFVCWRAFAENAWMQVPMAAAMQHLPQPPQPPDPLAPGPFAYADPERLRGILAEAGLVGVEIAASDIPIGAPDLDKAVDLTMKVGPLGAILRDHPEQAAVVIGAVRRALEPYGGPGGVRLPSATWIVTARAP